MKVPYVTGPGVLELQDVEEPSAGPGDVVLKVHTVGICGSDLGMLAMGGIGRPLALGHELTGTITEAGADVTQFKVGQRVFLNPLMNMIGNGGPEGGFADRLLVRDVVGKPGSLLPLPDDVTMEDGALIEPLAVASHAADRLGAAPGAKMAIFGAGPIGLALLTVLRHRGIDDVVVFDLSASRRERAQKIGARRVSDPNEEAFRQVLIDLHGGVQGLGGELPQTSHYLEVTGAPIVGDILNAAAPRSTICIVALHKKPATIEFRDVMAKELTLVGTMGYPSQFDEAIEMMQGGKVDMEALVSHRFDGSAVLDAFEAAKKTESSAKVLVQYGS